MTNTEKRKEHERQEFHLRDAVKTACIEILEADVPPADKLKAIDTLNKLHLI